MKVGGAGARLFLASAPSSTSGGGGSPTPTRRAASPEGRSGGGGTRNNESTTGGGDGTAAADISELLTEMFCIKENGGSGGGAAMTEDTASLALQDKFLFQCMSLALTEVEMKNKIEQRLETELARSKEEYSKVVSKSLGVERQREERVTQLAIRTLEARKRIRERRELKSLETMERKREKDLLTQVNHLRLSILLTFFYFLTRSLIHSHTTIAALLTDESRSSCIKPRAAKSHCKR
jgi:hypothetical protein